MSSPTRKPFLLSPVGKDYLWGGSRLNDDFGMQLPMNPLAEAWVCSTHPDGRSVATGTGETLSAMLEENPNWLGTHPLSITGGKVELPVLIKLIDAHRNLSVQVHPDDEYAWKNEGQPGKTEMWYVLDAKPGSTLVYGFNRDVTEQQVREGIESGRIETLLNHVPVHRNDVFYIPAGTVHAIGEGALIAEIQQNSNVTYRLYDYNRGRETHVDKSLAVANRKNSAVPRQPMRVLKYKNGAASELLGRCRYFQVERLLLNTEGRKTPEFRAEQNSFHALLCVDGCGVLFGDGIDLPFFKGDCLFVPADSIPLRLHGYAQLLDVSC